MKVNYPKTFILIGRSGCGKGTQAKLIQEWLEKEASTFPVFYLESGVRFRDFVKSDGYSNKLAREISKEGGLQPAFLAVWVWANIFIENITGTKHLIIDGTPRKVDEAHLLYGALRFYKREKPYFIYINVSEAWARERLHARGRSDDVIKESIDKRMKWFETDVLPAINFFRDKPDYHFLDINGEQKIEKVYEDILSRIKKYSCD